MHDAITRQVDASFALAEKRLGRSFPRPRVRCDLRGRAAGSARLQDWELRFNPLLYAGNESAFLTQVVPHEVAHLLVYALWGTGRGKNRVLPHGPQWQSVMQTIFELPPEVTHRFDLAPLAERTFPYRCDCQEHALSLRRHNKVLRGLAHYRCRHCQGALRPLANHNGDPDLPDLANPFHDKRALS